MQVLTLPGYVLYFLTALYYLLCLPLNVYLHIYLFTYSQYWKNNDIEKHFKKYAQE